MKRLLVKLRYSWRSTFRDIDYIDSQLDLVKEDMTKDLMRVTIEHRFEILRNIEKQVLKETLEKAMELKKESDNILLKLEMYNQSKTNLL